MAVLSLCAIFTIGARRLFPIWDDAWLWLLLEEEGLGAILPSHPERPVIVRLWLLLAPSIGDFWRNAQLAQAVVWPILALQSALLWRRLFPQLARYAGVVGLVAIAPFVTKVQMLTANVALASMLSVILGYLGVLLALRFVASTSRGGYFVLLAGAASMATGVLLQEYAVAVGAAGTVLLLFEWWRQTQAGARRRSLLAAASLAAVSLGAYAVYLRIADFDSPAARQVLNPGEFLDLRQALDGLWTVLPQALFQGVFGGFLRAVEGLARTDHSLLMAVLFGTVVAFLATWGCRRTGTAREKSMERRQGWAWLALVVGLIAALSPVIIAGEYPWNPVDGMASRFGLPALPVLAMLIVYPIARSRPYRLRWVPVAALGFLAGAVAVVDFQEETAEARSVASIGACLQPYVEASDGITVAVVPTVRRSLGPARQWELTARLAAEYPPGLSKKLWSYRDGGGPSLRYKDTARKAFGPRDRCRRPRRLNRKVRNLRRVGPLGRLLWTAESADGTVVLETYCQRRADDDGFRATCTAVESGAGVGGGCP